MHNAYISLVYKYVFTEVREVRGNISMQSPLLNRSRRVKNIAPLRSQITDNRIFSSDLLWKYGPILNCMHL